MSRDHVTANWSTAVMVCGKCSKRQGGGFGPKGKTGLLKALRRLVPKARGRKAAFGLIEMRCQKICPRHAVLVVDGRRPADWLLVRPGTPVAEVAARLGLTTERPD
ncbi:hypothetical protein [Sphingomonas quercus]|uniref:(2Fe-2S) ferredoxin domain-containing protein n=1 Tax=Sphingomonas quercus TaxID=2842451 RepID=A0ABS6BKP2_9SPHN|nr:hypothetical protein [Sphingomonas quercus]MBU3078386.1 hypothetical protein [Sphingomonas quercus]